MRLRRRLYADPLRGYIVRTSSEGWMQGFITVTSFTTWQRYFAWDSLVQEAGVLDDAEDEEVPRICDVTGEISRELDARYTLRLIVSPTYSCCTPTRVMCIVWAVRSQLAGWWMPACTTATQAARA
eukprot:COSAG05_NODE_716_length_7804_cov_2.669825_16_plen_126_part_00